MLIRPDNESGMARDAPAPTVMNWTHLSPARSDALGEVRDDEQQLRRADASERTSTYVALLQQASKRTRTYPTIGHP